MIKTLSLFALASLLGATASAQVIVDFRDADGSTDQIYTFSIPDTSSGFGFDMEMLMTATVTSGQTFEQWNEDDNAKDRGLGFSEVDQGWDSWIGTESPRPSTEGVALTFREAVTENPVEVDLGTGGLSLHLLGRGGDTPTINGSDVTGLTTNDFNTVIASATGLETITAFANASNDKTDFALDTLDINNATVIPEPSTFALLTGVLGLGLVILRRRPRS